MEPTKKKIAVIGDIGIGKSTLAMVISSGQPLTEDSEDKAWNFECVPTILSIENDTVELEWCDLKSKYASEDSRLRPLLYQNSAVILTCFNIGKPTSLASIESRWHPETSHWFPEIPVIIVGTMKDQRSPNIQRLQVSFEEGKAVADRVNAFAYVECSAKTNEGIEDLLMATARASLIPQQRRKKKKCVIS